MHSVKKVCQISAALIVTIAGFLVLPTFGQEKNAKKLVLPTFGQEKIAKKTVGPFTGTVVDATGKPVAGATVWLLGYAGDPRDFGSRADFHIVAETKSDEKGGFQMAEQKRDDPTASPMPFLVTARDSQGRIGGQTRVYSQAVANSPDAPYRDMRLELHEVKDYHGRLVDTEGGPIAKARIRPEGCSLNNPAAKSYSSCVFPSHLNDELATETDADGSFTIRKLPLRGQLSLTIRAEGFGKPRATINLEKSGDPSDRPDGRRAGIGDLRKEPHSRCRNKTANLRGFSPKRTDSKADATRLPSLLLRQRRHAKGRHFSDRERFTRIVFASTLATG